MAAGYRTVPPCDDLMGMSDKALAEVRDFTVVREGMGSIMWPGITDIRGLGLDEIVSIDNNEVCVWGGGGWGG
jgi:nuclear pore complex protein Nup98-Nup96